MFKKFMLLPQLKKNETGWSLFLLNCKNNKNLNKTKKFRNSALVSLATGTTSSSLDNKIPVKINRY